MADEARRLGLILSNETIKQAAAADDEFDKIGLALKVAGVNMTAGFLPALEKIRDVVTSREFQQGVKDFGANMGAAIKYMVDNAETIRTTAFVLGGMFVGGRVAGPIGAATLGLVGYTAAAVTAGETIGGVTTQLNQAYQEFNRLQGIKAGTIKSRLFGAEDPQVLEDNIKEITEQIIQLHEKEAQLIDQGLPTDAGTVRKKPGPVIDPEAGMVAKRLQEELDAIRFKTQIANNEFRNFAEGFPEAAAKLKLFGQSGLEFRTTVESLPPGLVKLNEQMAVFNAVKLNQENLAPWQQYALEVDKVNKALATGILSAPAYERAMTKAAEKTGQAWDTALSGITGQFASATKEFAGNNKALGAVSKAFAIAQAVINTYTAATKALAIYGPTPLGYAGVAAALVTGFAQVAKIRAEKFATGGQFTVPGGMGGSDSKLIPIKAFPGERVTVETPEQQRRSTEYREITIRVDEISRATVEKLIPALNMALADGHRLKVA